jgi:hypothetical protein
LALTAFVFLPALCGKEEDTMSRKAKVSWIFSLLLWSSLQSLVLASDSSTRQELLDQRETSHPKQESRVTVLVYNYARLPMETLRETEDRATLIFRKAGVEVDWADCPLNNEDPALYPGCPELSGPTQLFLRIFAKTATKVDIGGEAFVAARIANIFWNRVEEQAQRLNVAAPRFLAHTVAHELGHLLLGSNSHSPVGIMTARWDAPTVTRIRQEGLYFHGQQSELMRSEMSKRKGQPMIVENAMLSSPR